MVSPIKLTDVISIPFPNQFKLHLASKNDIGEHPLDHYVQDRNKWIGWNEWRGKKDEWTRKYIFSFIEYTHIPNAYLFGGAFEVVESCSDRFILKELTEYAKWEGRLICKFYRKPGLRGRAFYLEKFIDEFDVIQVLPARYDGERFCGYENINHSFSTLKALIQSGKQDWMHKLSNVKGVYIIMDNQTGQSYIGSAYGNDGIWSRLNCYVNTGHGWNDGLVELIKEKGMEYALANFYFSVLEIIKFDSPDEDILQREAHWKNVMLTRKFGYNKN